METNVKLDTCTVFITINVFTDRNMYASLDFQFLSPLGLCPEAKFIVPECANFIPPVRDYEFGYCTVYVHVSFLSKYSCMF
jgi:hypothetical protein